MASTHLPSSLGVPTSQYRIQCNAGSILIGDREFLSATDALEAYLSQYETQGFLNNQPTYKRTVNDLLNPKSALHMTAERSLETGIRATDTELRLADQKDSINESLLNMKKSVSLKAEVEEALNKSQELIRQINTDDFPSNTNVPSDVGSLATDVLVSMDPVEGYQGAGDPGTSTLPAWKSKHVFGYKRPRNRRSKTLSSIQIAHDMMGLTADQPQHSFTAQPNEKAPQHVTFQDADVPVSPIKGEVGKYDDDVSLLLGESPNTSRLSRSPAKTLRERSRSVSPSILKRERKMFESGLRDKPIPDFYTDFNTSIPKAPSWVDTMNMSDISESDWKKRDFTVSKPPPSWVNDIDNSDITSVISAAKPGKKLEFHDLLRPLPVINTQNSSSNTDANDTLPPPGLTYKDLVGDTSKVKSGNTQNQGRSGSPTLSDKLHHLKSKTDAAMQRYHQRMQSDINIDSPSKGSNPYTRDDVPRCSSLDTAALLAGIPPPGKSDITGASPIMPGDNDSTVTGAGSPGKPRRAPSPDTDIVLEGDRPWEKMVPFKAPVTVAKNSKGSINDQQNYSGGSQPGSLEALKNMIFKLQQEAVHTDSEDEGSRSKLSERVHKLRAEAASLGIQVPADRVDNKTGKVPGDIPSLKGYDFQGEPGGQSLEKALVHLDRLKTMVNAQGDGQSGAAGVTPLCSHMEDQK
ncbi:uncharacterized protein LOC123566021 isoform X2 [Mercenaria mercenaria]|uniref:uncharacterized protein LOC123566021 isoform X2 n=1 Tax=Mercenaria mercenaria TaxID=6596 RepID=UPI00234EB336|nr:uncharacterized protein LOC123566021 isoform X2 [Mercenaria mercenaria]